MRSKGNLVSLSPKGEIVPLPSEADFAAEICAWLSWPPRPTPKAKKWWWFMGMDFVGAVMAAVVVDSVNKQGQPGKFVIGMQRPSPRSSWKIPLLNRGLAPVKAEDPEVDECIARCVNEKKMLTASFSYEALALADVVGDVQCDYSKAALEDSLKEIAGRIPPHCLVLIERNHRAA